MEITLNESEITQAIKQFITGSGINVAGQDLEVTLTAGRGPNGHSAAVKLVSPADPTEEAGNTMQEPFEMQKKDPESETQKEEKSPPKAKKSKKKAAPKKATKEPEPEKEEEPAEISTQASGAVVGENADDVESLFNN